MTWLISKRSRCAAAAKQNGIKALTTSEDTFHKMQISPVMSFNNVLMTAFPEMSDVDPPSNGLLLHFILIVPSIML